MTGTKFLRTIFVDSITPIPTVNLPVLSRTVFSCCIQAAIGCYSRGCKHLVNRSFCAVFARHRTAARGCKLNVISLCAALCVIHFIPVPSHFLVGGRL